MKNEFTTEGGIKMRVMDKKVIYCPKQEDFVFLSDCEKCKYFRGVKHLTHVYIDCELKRTGLKILNTKYGAKLREKQ